MVIDARGWPGEDPPVAYPNRIRELREKAGLSAPDLAEAAGTSVQQLYRLEKGERRLTQGWMERLAQALGCQPADLITSPEVPFGRTVPLVGYVGAGEMYYPDPLVGAWGGIDEVEAPPGVADVAAVRVRGQSMAPVYRDGDLLYFAARLPPVQCVNRDCIVQVRNGPTFVKYLERSSTEGLYTLRSYGREVSDIEDVDVEWAAPVVWLKRA